MRTALINMNREDFDPTRHVRIDRQSQWGNPFFLNNKNDNDERMEVLWKYTLYILRDRQLLGKLYHLKGKTLACWCTPKMCHGDILIYIAVHLDIVERCSKPSCNREQIAEEIFKDLGWTHKKKYEQTTLF